MTLQSKPCRVETELQIHRHGLALGAGREKALLPTAVSGVYVSLVQAACFPGNLPPREATSSWQTQAVFKQQVQTRSAPGGGICPGS